jgi:hypothetical protein
MTVTAAGFPGQVNDVEWSQILSLLGYEGTTGMVVLAVAGDRTVSVSAGSSNVGGVLATNDDAVTLQAAPNGASNTRIDSVILRATWSSSALELVVKQGTPSSSPSPPSLTKTAGVLWELALAQLTVAPGQGAFAGGDVQNARTPPAVNVFRTSDLAAFPDPSRGALVFYTAGTNRSLRVPINGVYTEIAHGRGKEFGCGVFGPFTPAGSGQANLTHGLGWTPTTMTFTRHDPDADAGVIDVTIRFMTANSVGITLKQPANGLPFTATVDALGWQAMRNV